MANAEPAMKNYPELCAFERRAHGVPVLHTFYDLAPVSSGFSSGVNPGSSAVFDRAD
ncbi:hypothetical protein [Bradyrhizobium sp. CCGE-LA001]|uniref:hypothetical protein n=1 Tax=Bradyrhizobium sp. CCGE-LA001 TaxID=1223566 RepID=UPI00131433DD|nr:hypothetical protein [Bradyrhizobium sp. CCGE-LA001]